MINIYQINEQDFVAVENDKQAKKFYSELSYDENFEDFRELTEKELETLLFVREDEEGITDSNKVVTFKKQLDYLIENGFKFPLYFASSE